MADEEARELASLESHLENERVGLKGSKTAKRK